MCTGELICCWSNWSVSLCLCPATSTPSPSFLLRFLWGAVERAVCLPPCDNENNPFWPWTRSTAPKLSRDIRILQWRPWLHRARSAWFTNALLALLLSFYGTKTPRRVQSAKYTPCCVCYFDTKLTNWAKVYGTWKVTSARNCLTQPRNFDFGQCKILFRRWNSTCSSRPNAWIWQELELRDFKLGWIRQVHDLIGIFVCPRWAVGRYRTCVHESGSRFPFSEQKAKQANERVRAWFEKRKQCANDSIVVQWLRLQHIQKVCAEQDNTNTNVTAKHCVRNSWTGETLKTTLCLIIVTQETDVYLAIFVYILGPI